MNVHLGWHTNPLALAAEWLLDRFGTQMDGVLVALPGARAGRLLRQRLARQAGPAWQPPQLLTAGAAPSDWVALS